MTGEALKQIVNLLQPVAALADGTPFEHSEVIQRCVDALEIALEALAQPAQEPDHGDELTIAYMSGVHRGKELAAQPAQEPVAWLDEEEKIIYWHNTHETDDHYGFRRTTPLYTTPQQRPWVGLTLDERYECIHGESVDAWDIAEAIEAKLKEKNT
jgi:hypothetical protein